MRFTIHTVYEGITQEWLDEYLFILKDGGWGDSAFECKDKGFAEFTTTADQMHGDGLGFKIATTRIEIAP